MRIKKYDFDYGRRMLMEKAMKGVAGAGVLGAAWPMISNGADASKAYPDELLHIDAYTKGKIKPGDVVDASNVDVVKDLLDPITFQQVKTMGRRINIVASTTDVSKLFNPSYFDATLRNQGKAKFDANGNIVTDQGEPWIGGNPFPDAKDGNEAIANLTLSWGRNDFSIYAIRDWDITSAGDIAYKYDFVWAELNATGRTTDKNGPYLPGQKDKLRFQSVWFTSPQDAAGTSFLNTWKYDQRQFPELVGYLPAFKRVRQFPANQRFEPLVPGVTLFLSDAWAAGDPMLTWGNYKIVERKPHLGAISNSWHGTKPNWEPSVHGGPKGQTFFETYMELIPEVIVLEAEPIGYPRAPVGKKRVWIDTRNSMFVAYVTYDRRGQIWKSFEPGFCQYIDGATTLKDSNGKQVWSWTHVLSHDIQSNRMSRFHQAKEVTGGYKSAHDAQGQDVFSKYLTNQAIQRLGSA